MGLDHRAEGNKGFAGAHVALEEAIHAARRGHVGVDLGDDLALRGRELEGERGFDAGPDFSVAWTSDAAGVLNQRVARGEDDLDSEKNIAHELSAGGFAFGGRFGEMNRAPNVGEDSFRRMFRGPERRD
jgi:hypothetical protein